MQKSSSTCLTIERKIVRNFQIFSTVSQLFFTKVNVREWVQHVIVHVISKYEHSIVFTVFDCIF